MVDAAYNMYNNVGQKIPDFPNRARLFKANDVVS